MKALGRHLLVEYSGCDRATLEEVSRIQALMEEAARVSGATIVQTCFHQFNPFGVSGVVVISESHLTIHTWPEHGFAAVDVFSCCRKLRHAEVRRFLKEALGARRVESRTLLRGEGGGEGLGRQTGISTHESGFLAGVWVAIRREPFEAAGGFDERFWLYGEETDLCRRVAELGWSITTAPEAVATHIGGASGGDSPKAAALVAEHLMRGGEHFVHKHEGTRALVSYRFANLIGSLLRGGLGVGNRSALHRARARRLLRTLQQAPRTVALDSPATRAEGKGLIVCSLEAWDEVWRRNQFLVRELLAADPDLRILFVEPAFDVVHERRRGSDRDHQQGLRPLEADGRVVRLEPVKWLPRRLGPFADRLRDRQVRRAGAALGFGAPRLWVKDPSDASLVAPVGTCRSSDRGTGAMPRSSDVA